MLRIKALLFAATLLGVGASAEAVETVETDRDRPLTVYRHEDLSQEKKSGTSDPLKFGSLRLGLDAMSRGESADHFSLAGFTFTPEAGDTRLLLRVRPSLSYAPTEQVAARVEGQWYSLHGGTDSGSMRLYQGYLEGSLPKKKVSLKAGRQELIYGTAFMIGSDSFFDGLSFDAVKLGLKPVEAIEIDFFAGMYTKDNSGGIAGELYGAYGAYRLSDNLAVDLYYLLDTGGDGQVNQGKDKQRYSIGTRLAARIGNRISLEVEPVYQFGRHVENTSHHSIRAFGGHTELTVDSVIDRYPVRGVIGYAFGSGDSDATQGAFTEFHNPDNDTPLIGDMGVIGDLSGVTAIDRGGKEIRASGLHVVTVGGGVDLSDAFNVSLDGHYVRAVNSPDGISREVGFETNLILTYKVSSTMALFASLNRFFTGGFFRDATGSGKGINYGYLQMQAIF